MISDTLDPLKTNLRILSLANATVSDGDLNALIKGLCGNSSLYVLSLASLGLKKVPRDVLEAVQYSLRSVSFFNNDFKTTSSNISEPIQSDDFKNRESEFHNVVKNGQDYLASILQETTCNVSTGEDVHSRLHTHDLYERMLTNIFFSRIPLGRFSLDAIFDGIGSTSVQYRFN